MKTELVKSSGSTFLDIFPTSGRTPATKSGSAINRKTNSPPLSQEQADNRGDSQKSADGPSQIVGIVAGMSGLKQTGERPAPRR